MRRCHFCYPNIGAFGAALLLSHAGFGQSAPLSIPNYHYTPPVPSMNMNMPPYGWGSRPESLAHRDGAGSYQLPDGSWHRAQRLVFNGEKLTVQDGATGKQRFTSETVRQLEVKQDTFLVVKDLPGRRVAPEKPDFLRSCVNRQGVRLLAMYYETGRPTYFLSRPNASMQLLPSGKAEFKTAMLAIVKDSPALTAKVASGEMGRDEAEQLIKDYADFLQGNALH
ncbi:hypothetical protein [Hymenobacter terricola]|uniref:hypothetical protein n=1 Tax=Hymenobacter terricola TaxID=2819236 RepID=UPI001B301898|nr:hypothetical protein [Hymenobacter terricola]